MLYFKFKYDFFSAAIASVGLVALAHFVSTNRRADRYLRCHFSRCFVKITKSDIFIPAYASMPLSNNSANMSVPQCQIPRH